MSNWVRLSDYIFNERESRLVPGQESFYPRYIVRITTENDFHHHTGAFRNGLHAESIWRTFDEAKNHIEDNMRKILHIPFKPADVEPPPSLSKQWAPQYDPSNWFLAVVNYKEARRQPEKTIFKLKRELDLTGFQSGWDKYINRRAQEDEEDRRRFGFFS